jgi:thimet oligopeptidase
MAELRTGVLGRQAPEAVLLCNFPGDVEGDPGLMELGEVATFFHEFGHVVHHLFAGRHRWCGLGGVKTEMDFVEAPSQLLEEWAKDPAALATFARHHETGGPVPEELILRLRRADEVGRALDVRSQMVFAKLSLALHDRAPSDLDPHRLATEVWRRYQLAATDESVHYYASFDHLEDYSALYYSYMWSLVIAKDLFARFDASRLLDAGVAKRYRDAVLAPGGFRPAERLVEEFLGRPFEFAAWEAWLGEAS